MTSGIKSALINFTLNLDFWHNHNLISIKTIIHLTLRSDIGLIATIVTSHLYTVHTTLSPLKRQLQGVSGPRHTIMKNVKFLN